MNMKYAFFTRFRIINYISINLFAYSKKRNMRASISIEAQNKNTHSISNISISLAFLYMKIWMDRQRDFIE